MANDLLTIVKASAKRLLPSIIDIRRDLHQHPELSFEEKRTSESIKTFLAKYQIPFTEGWAGYGIVASIRGEADGPLVMLRADMDALPITEANDVPYRSLHEGIMHACGHDVHTSSLLGAAVILHENKKSIHGEIRMIFQPGEEKLPGGASLMIDEGLFSVGSPEWIIAQHVHPPLQAGHVGFRGGLYMASSDEIYITIKGKGGHAATPHLAIDPIVISARVITALQEMVSRSIDPLSPGVLTIGKINSEGGATNVIPDNVHLEGTLRAMDEKWRMDTHHRIRNLIEKICEASGAAATVNIVTGYPSLINDEGVTTICRNAAIDYLGADKVHELPQRMTSEDFAFYSQKVPASFYRLGTGWPETEKNFPVHSNRFDINETALETGMGLMAYITLTALSAPQD
jgi:amidohydrolase